MAEVEYTPPCCRLLWLMKATALPGLDAYDSDEELDAVVSGDGAQKRKLPPLSSLSADAGSGKKPVQGEWLCYCFIEISAPEKLRTLIERAHALTQETLPATCRVQGVQESALHISLTRPITVRAHERDEFVAEATSALPAQCSFALAFSRFARLRNDEATREFLVLEVGAGREQLRRLSDALSASLHRAFRAQPYYADARFHASTGYIDLTEPASLANAVDQLEPQLGDALRALPPTPAHRLGIQVGASITYL